MELFRGDVSDCQPAGTLPRGTTAVRLAFETIAVGPRVGIKLMAGSRVVTAGERAAGWGVAQSVIVPVGRVSRTARGVRLCMSIGPTVEPFRARGVLVHPGATGAPLLQEVRLGANTCVQAADRGCLSRRRSRSHGRRQCLGRIVDRVLPTRADARHICSRLVGNAERDPMSERSQAGSRAWSAATGRLSGDPPGRRQMARIVVLPGYASSASDTGLSRVGVLVMRFGASPGLLGQPSSPS